MYYVTHTLLNDDTAIKSFVVPLFDNPRITKGEQEKCTHVYAT